MRGMMWLAALGCGILLSSSGCCGFLGNGCGGRGCGCRACDSDCGSACGACRRPVRQQPCDDDCGSCGPRSNCGCAKCDTCGNSCDCCSSCCERNFCFHPFRWLGNLFCRDTWCGPTCGCGCGCGEGSAPGESYGGGGHGGCASCNHGGEYEGEGMSPAPAAMPLQDDPSLQPTPAGSAPTKATSQRIAPSYER